MTRESQQAEAVRVGKEDRAFGTGQEAGAIVRRALEEAGMVCGAVADGERLQSMIWQDSETRESYLAGYREGWLQEGERIRAEGCGVPFEAWGVKREVKRADPAYHVNGYQIDYGLSVPGDCGRIIGRGQALVALLRASGELGAVGTEVLVSGAKSWGSVQWRGSCYTAEYSSSDDDGAAVCRRFRASEVADALAWVESGVAGAVWCEDAQEVA